MLSLQEQPYTVNARTFLTIFQTEASLDSVSYPLKTTAARLLPARIPSTLYCESHLPSRPFLFLTNTMRPLPLHTLHSFSSLSSPSAVHHLFYGLSLTSSAGSIQSRHSEQHLLLKRIRLQFRQNPLLSVAFALELPSTFCVQVTHRTVFADSAKCSDAGVHGECGPRWCL